MISQFLCYFFSLHFLSTSSSSHWKWYSNVDHADADGNDDDNVGADDDDDMMMIIMLILYDGEYSNFTVV